MRDAFTSTRTLSALPRLPLKGSIDLTYRCNNRCRHCWLWTDRGEGELTKEEICDIVDQARAMGCREWAISGGGQMELGASTKITTQMTGFEGSRPLSHCVCGDKIALMDYYCQAVS